MPLRSMNDSKGRTRRREEEQKEKKRKVAAKFIFFIKGYKISKTKVQ